MSPQSVVIIGAGHAGVQAAASLREEGFDGRVTLLSNEPEFPYQRPPLSKAFLKGQMQLSGLPLRGEKFFDEQRIDLRLGVAAARIDRAGRRVEFAHGGAESYDHLILATGARARVLRAPGPRSRRRPRVANNSRCGGDQAASRNRQARRRDRRRLHRPGDRRDRAGARRRGDDRRDRRPADGPGDFPGHVGVFSRRPSRLRRALRVRPRRHGAAGRERPCDRGGAIRRTPSAG